MDQEIDKEQLWAALEIQSRESFEDNLTRMKTAILDDHPVKKSEKKDGPPIVPVRLMYYDREQMVPLEIIDYDFLGTREEIHRIISRRHKELLESAEYVRIRIRCS